MLDGDMLIYQNALRASSKNTWGKMTRSNANELKF